VTAATSVGAEPDPPPAASRDSRTVRARGDRRRELSPVTRWTLRLTSVVVLLAAWQIFGRTRPILLSTPSAVFTAGVDMIRDGTLPHALTTSLAELGLGFSTGAVAGVLLGLAAGRSQVIDALLYLPVNGLYATPFVTLIPVIVLWFGFGITSRAIVVFFFVIFPVFISTLRGVHEVDPDLIEVARSFCSSERRMWVDLILPSCLPYVVTGLRLAIGRALIGVVVAEFYTALSGLGDLIITSASNFQTARMWVPIVVIALIGIILTAVLEWAEQRLARWRKTT
jgi:ABC-type nitrate/sulfonate/bicarbonate transport system permease component